MVDRREDEPVALHVKVDAFDQRLFHSGRKRSGGANRSRLLRTYDIAVWFLATQSLFWAGCDGCGKRDPYVPFSMSAATSASSASAEVSAEQPPAAGSYLVVQGKPPGADGKTFVVGGSTMNAKKGRVFRSGLVLDADGDGTEDLIAWTEASAGSKGELGFFRGGGTESTDTALAKLPADLDIEHCAHDAALSRIGNGVVVVKVTAECSDPKRTEEWLAVARLDAEKETTTPKVPESRLELRVSEPLSVDPRAEDRDKDGREDLVFLAHRAGEKAADRAQASLVLWDRPAGYAWDPSEPEASLGKLGQSLLAKAVAKKADTVARAEAALGFATALCNDLGAGRVKSTAGVPKCQDSRVIGDALHAVALSSLASGDLGRAAGAADVITSLKIDGGRSTQLDQSFGKKLKKVEAIAVRKPTARPRKSALLSPLWFDGAGALHIAGEDGVTKVDPTSGDESASDVPGWGRALGWGDGESHVEVTGANVRCAPVASALAFSAKGSASELEVPLFASLVPRATIKEKCEKTSAKLSILAVDAQGALVSFKGEGFRLAYGDAGLTATKASFDASAPATPGTSRSPDGSIGVIALGRSVLLLKSGGAERWRGADASGLRGCVATNAGDRVACLNGENVVVLGPKK